jgi:hypothetical protein
MLKECIIICTSGSRTLPYGTTSVLIALSGSFDVVLKDGKSKK